MTAVNCNIRQKESDPMKGFVHWMMKEEVSCCSIPPSSQIQYCSLSHQVKQYLFGQLITHHQSFHRCGYGFASVCVFLQMQTEGEETLSRKEDGVD